MSYVDEYGQTVNDDGSPINSTSPFSFDGVFAKAAGLATDLGGQYLTARGQQAIAAATSAGQSRINGYSAVNPSLGAVNPVAAQKVANESLVSRWLPWGTPIAGSAATTATQPSQTGKVMAIVAVVVVLFIVWKIVRK